jgi:hypothetical protein
MDIPLNNAKRDLAEKFVGTNYATKMQVVSAMSCGLLAVLHLMRRPQTVIRFTGNTVDAARLLSATRSPSKGFFPPLRSLRFPRRSTDEQTIAWLSTTASAMCGATVLGGCLVLGAISGREIRLKRKQRGVEALRNGAQDAADQSETLWVDVPQDHYSVKVEDGQVSAERVERVESRSQELRSTAQPKGKNFTTDCLSLDLPLSTLRHETAFAANTVSGLGADYSSIQGLTSGQTYKVGLSKNNGNAVYFAACASAAASIILGDLSGRWLITGMEHLTQVAHTIMSKESAAEVSPLFFYRTGPLSAGQTFTILRMAGISTVPKHYRPPLIAMAVGFGFACVGLAPAKSKMSGEKIL